MVPHPQTCNQPSISDMRWMCEWLVFNLCCMLKVKMLSVKILIGWHIFDKIHNQGLCGKDKAGYIGWASKTNQRNHMHMLILIGSTLTGTWMWYYHWIRTKYYSVSPKNVKVVSWRSGNKQCAYIDTCMHKRADPWGLEWITPSSFMERKRPNLRVLNAKCSVDHGVSFISDKEEKVSLCVINVANKLYYDDGCFELIQDI